MPFVFECDPTIYLSPPLAIVTGSPLPTGTVGVPYSVTFSGFGGIKPYNWSIPYNNQFRFVANDLVTFVTFAGTGGGSINWVVTLPTWYSIAPLTGVFGGTPTGTETDAIPVQLTDSAGTSVQAVFSLTVVAQPSITTTSPLPTGTVGLAYSTTITGIGGATPYNWTLVSAIPNTGNWQSLDPFTGKLTGTPTTIETETDVIQLRDSLGNTVSQSFSLPVTGASNLAITTASLPNGLVGQPYSATIAIVGGSPPYSCNIVSATQNSDLWLRCAGMALTGIPEMTETTTVVIQANDSLGASVQATFTFLVTATGALAIVAPQGLTLSQYYQGQQPVVGTLFSLRMLVTGGQPPYFWNFPGPAFAITGGGTATNYALPQSGWLSCASVTAGTDSFTVQVTDSNGTVVTQSVSVAHQSSGLAFYPIDLRGGSAVVNLPPAFASTAYNYQFKVAGGTGIGRVFSVASGVLPAGLNLSPSGQLTGRPALAGSVGSCQIKCIDSGSNTATVPIYLNIASFDQVSRPGYNTGTGFFVDGNGVFRDPVGLRYQFRAVDRAHYDAASWAGGLNGALATPGIARTFYFVINNQTTAQQMANALAQNIQNEIVPVLSMGYFPDGIGTSGHGSITELASGVDFWIQGAAAFAPYMGQIIVNMANEWGSQTSSDPAWANAHTAVIGSISAMAGTTITVNTVAGANPFANCGFAYVLGAGGITNQTVLLSSPGGSSGAWTVVASKLITAQVIGTGNGVLTTFAGTLSIPVLAGSVVVSDSAQQWWGTDNGAGAIVDVNGGVTGTINYATGAISVTFSSAPPNGNTIKATYGQTASLGAYTSGGTLNGGTLGAMRTSYLCPLMIDANTSGGDPWGIVNLGPGDHGFRSAAERHPGASFLSLRTALSGDDRFDHDRSQHHSPAPDRQQCQSSDGAFRWHQQFCPSLLHQRRIGDDSGQWRIRRIEYPGRKRWLLERNAECQQHRMVRQLHCQQRVCVPGRPHERERGFPPDLQQVCRSSIVRCVCRHHGDGTWKSEWLTHQHARMDQWPMDEPRSGNLCGRSQSTAVVRVGMGRPQRRHLGLPSVCE